MMKNDAQGNELKALISLIDEPDDKIYKEIKEKIYSYGADAITELEIAWENFLEPHLQKRIEGLIKVIQFENVQSELKNWVDFGGKNLLLGWIIISKYQYPNIKEEEIKKQIDLIKNDIWLELNDNLTALEKVRIINHIFYDIYGFTGNSSNFHEPQNSFINNVLDSKKGNPLSLGVIYSIVSQSLNFPIYGVNLPEHFVLAYTNEKRSDSLSFIDKNEVLFYLNPFKKGIVFSKKEITSFLSELKLPYTDAFIKPCSNIDIIRRFLNNLIFSYGQLKATSKIAEMKLLLSIINKEV
jgi:regulator of sirC expression with transglutaminase-like and TPR domain